MEKSQVQEELAGSHLVYKLGGDWPEKFIIELSPYARHCVMHPTYTHTRTSVRAQFSGGD